MDRVNGGSFKVTIWSVVFGAAFAFMAGAAAAWAVFGIQWRFEFGDSIGSRADWIAAIGTWVIGYAAWQVSRQAQAHRAREVRELKRDGALAKRGVLRGITNALTHAGAQERGLKNLLKSDRPVNLATTEAILQFNMEGMAAMSWSETQRAALDEDGLAALGVLEVETLAYASISKQFRVLVGKDSDSFDARTSPRFQHLIDRAEALHTAATRLANECNRLITGLKLD